MHPPDPAPPALSAPGPLCALGLFHISEVLHRGRALLCRSPGRHQPGETAPPGRHPCTERCGAGRHRVSSPEWDFRMLRSGFGLGRAPVGPVCLMCAYMLEGKRACVPVHARKSAHSTPPGTSSPEWHWRDRHCAPKTTYGREAPHSLVKPFSSWVMGTPPIPQPLLDCHFDLAFSGEIHRTRE